MLRFAKFFSFVTVLALGVRSASGFALLGPINEAYQVVGTGHNLPGDLGGPKNMGEEYRRNTPVMYYAFNQGFFEFFGSNGVYAVEQAFGIYNGLTNVSSYSADLSEFPYEVQAHNYRAQALRLWDLKSRTMGLIAENLGLAEPERYVWTLHDRYLPPGGSCPPDMQYIVIKRNFDPVFTTTDTLQTSSYVNNTLYTYFINEPCIPPQAEAVEFVTDLLARQFTAVAGNADGQDEGGFFTSLTRDDIGGLRYLLRASNMNIESAGPDTFMFQTNTTPQLLVTSNLTELAEAAWTNDAPALRGLFPGLIIASTTNYFTLAVTTNYIAYFTNPPPGSPAGSPPRLINTYTLTTNVVERFVHTFANVVTNTYYVNGFRSVLTIAQGSCPGAPAGYVCPPVTNVTRTVVPKVSGDFYIIPPTNCGVQIISLIFSNVLASTNLIISATNAVGTTNVNAGTIFSQSEITYYTNHQFVVKWVSCPSNTVALRQGVERIRFERRDFDSLFNTFFTPVTNDYTLNAITNSTLFPQNMRRIIDIPDFLITSADLASGPNAPPVVGDAARNIIFNSSNAVAQLAGPGTIERPTLFTMDRVGPAYYNPAQIFLPPVRPVPPFTELTHEQALLWGSFDGSTNSPIVYPNGTDITNIENQVLMQVSPAGPGLPDGQVGVNYTAFFGGFSVIGGNPPYQWALAPGSPGLPPGLVLNPNGSISGFPDSSTAGLTYDVVVRLTDSGQRYVDRPYSITISP